MIIAKADVSNIDDILKIVNQAKEYLKSQNVDQWQDGYPDKESFLNDIKNDCLYIAKENDETIGVFALINHEANYDVIYDGKWHSDDDYVAVHRIAVDNNYKGKGIAKFIFDYIKESYNYIRVDTHKDNQNMQRCLIKNGFKYCGIIYLARDNGQRMAFDYIDDKK